MRLLTGQREPDAGTIAIGTTVVAATLPQTIVPGNPDDRVLPSVERLRREIEIGGRTVTAGTLLEDFGFKGEKAMTRIGDLSGGEVRRLELLKLLIGGPNLLVLDEPTNDLDVETLAVIEDVLDSWPGSLVVVSHDRYFLERTCDDLYALLGDGRLRHLPRGVEQYLELRRSATGSLLSTDAGAAGRAGGRTVRGASAGRPSALVLLPRPGHRCISSARPSAAGAPPGTAAGAPRPRSPGPRLTPPARTSPGSRRGWPGSRPCAGPCTPRWPTRTPTTSGCWPWQPRTQPWPTSSRPGNRWLDLAEALET